MSTINKLAKAIKNAKGPKQGSARSNQSVKYSKADGDLIDTVIPAVTGNGVVVTSKAGKSVTRPTYGDSGAFRKLAMTGKSFAALADWCVTNPAEKPNAKLANGLDGRSAPHSAKAVADQKAAPAPKGKAKPIAKAAKNKAPSKGTDRTYKIGKTKNEARPDTWRYYMLATIMGSKDTASAKAAHAKSGKFSSNKLDFTWADQKGYITFTK